MIEAGDNPEAVLQRADQALYRAKKQGGNRVVAAETATRETSLEPRELSFS